MAAVLLVMKREVRYRTERLSDCFFLIRCLSSFVGLHSLVLEYYCWYTENIVTISVLNALSIGSGLEAAVLLLMKDLFQPVHFMF